MFYRMMCKKILSTATKAAVKSFMWLSETDSSEILIIKVKVIIITTINIKIEGGDSITIMINKSVFYSN